MGNDTLTFYTVLKEIELKYLRGKKCISGLSYLKDYLIAIHGFV